MHHTENCIFSRQVNLSRAPAYRADLVATFGEEAPELLDELRAAQAEGAAERFRRAAHSLKGNGHTFGAMRLAEMARALEPGGLPASAAPVRLLAEELEHTLAALTSMAAGASP